MLPFLACSLRPMLLCDLLGRHIAMTTTARCNARLLGYCNAASDFDRQPTRRSVLVQARSDGARCLLPDVRCDKKIESRLK